MVETGERNGNSLLTSRFSVNELPQKLRYDAWRESISCIFDVSRSRTLSSEDEFHASVEAQMIGFVMLARTVTTRQLWKRSAVAMARDGMDHIMLQFYESGTQECEWRGGRLTMPSNGLLVYDLSQEMKAETTDFTNLSLILPRSMLEHKLNAPDDQHMRALDGADPLVALLRDHMLSLSRYADGLSLKEALALASVTAEFVAACLNSAGEDRPVSSLVEGPVLLLTLRKDIERRLMDLQLGPADLCARHEITRTRLYELFSPFGGVAAYIRERRLRAALVCLADPAVTALPIRIIAQRYGFSDSDFSRAFMRRYGLSPRAARHHGRQHDRRIAAPGPDRRYESWLRDLVP